MNQTTTEVSSPVLKTVAAWGSVGAAQGVAHLAGILGIHTWGDAAQFAAFGLSACYLAEWWWKRLLRPLLVRVGLMKPIHRVVRTVEESEE